jgi:type III restriction enzyme
MITVANRTETAARIKYTFDHGKIRIDELCAPERTLHIDSKVLDKAESREEAPEVIAAVDDESDGDEAEIDAPKKKLSKKDQAELLRRMVDTVGKVGAEGENIQNVISVGMLSEGWDAKTVTHIMGLRAFTSQLLCEQVVGRGLRRTSYDIRPGSTLLEPEYVNIFGVPFTFIPHEGGEGTPPPPPSPKTEVHPLSERIAFEIEWPNVVRIDYDFLPKLTLDIASVPVLQLDASATPTVADLAPIVEGKPDIKRISTIDLEELGKRFRMQRIVFEAARDVYDQVQPTWKGNREVLLAQVIRIVEKFLASDRISITPPLFNQDGVRRRIMLTVNMNKVVQHIFERIRFENVQTRDLVFDRERPTRRTGDMRTWYTGKPCEITQRSHINFCVYDSTWEATESYELERAKEIDAWVKNDHLGFEILYIWQGIVKKYRPDFLIRLTNGVHLVLEVKGQDTQENQSKRQFLDEWVKAVNSHGGFGVWAWDVVLQPKEVVAILRKHANTEVGLQKATV